MLAHLLDVAKGLLDLRGCPAFILCGQAGRIRHVQYARVDDTHFSVTAKVEISDQFFGWILGFGRKAKLLYPDDVIDQFKDYLDRIRDLYES